MRYAAEESTSASWVCFSELRAMAESFEGEASWQVGCFVYKAKRYCRHARGRERTQLHFLDDSQGDTWNTHQKASRYPQEKNGYEEWDVATARPLVLGGVGVREFPAEVALARHVWCNRLERAEVERRTRRERVAYLGAQPRSSP